MPELDRYEQARRRVEGKLGFMSHVAVYILVNALLIVINYLSTPERLWFFWPLLGWGIGLAFHAMGVFVFSSGSVMKERLIERELQKLDGIQARSAEREARRQGE